MAQITAGGGRNSGHRRSATLPSHLDIPDHGWSAFISDVYDRAITQSASYFADQDEHDCVLPPMLAAPFTRPGWGGSHSAG